MNRYFSFFWLLLMTSTANAQDVLVKKDGTILNVYNLEEGSNVYYYSTDATPDAPTLKISKEEVFSVKRNGTDVQTVKTSESSASMSNPSTPPTQQLVEKSADSRNAEIIALHNKEHGTIKELKQTSKANYCCQIFWISPTSVVSNDEIEMTFVRKKIDSPYSTRGGSNVYYAYQIVLQNKTDGYIYVDLGSSFRSASTGNVRCYYNAEQTTVSKSNSSGGALNLGGIAGALGVGGAIGQIAGGVSVGGGTSGGVSRTYNSQRILTIPPHGQRSLTEDKWVRTKDAGFWNNGDFDPVEISEWFDNVYWNYYKEMGVHIDPQYAKGQFDGGRTDFDEANSPFTLNYDISYSTSETFSTYSQLHAKLFVKMLLSRKTAVFNMYKEILEKYFDNVDQHTIGGLFWMEK